MLASHTKHNSVVSAVFIRQKRDAKTLVAMGQVLTLEESWPKYHNNVDW